MVVAMVASHAAIAFVARAMAQPARHQHLYVADDIKNQVVEFPVRADGLPETKPDRVIELNGPAYGLALDSAGNLYVSVEVPSNDGNIIQVFPPGATGRQQPKRIISLGPNTFPEFLAIDKDRHLYVDLANTSINVYAINNSMNLIAAIPVPDYINDIILDRSGALYVSELDQIGVYLQPLIRQTPDSLVLPQGGFEHAIVGSIAIDEVRGELYFQTSPAIEQRWGNFDFAARSLLAASPDKSVRPDSMILSDACVGPGQQAISYGAAVSGRYFLAGCDGSTAVFAFDKDEVGRRSPVEAIGKGYVQAEADIVVGP